MDMSSDVPKKLLPEKRKKFLLGKINNAFSEDIDPFKQ